MIPDSIPPETDPILVTLNHELSQTCSLVLSAVGIHHITIESGNGFELFVQPGAEEQARAELDSYFAENRNWPPQVPTRDDFQPFFHPPSLLMMGALFLFFTVTGPWQSKSIWFLGGAGETTAMLEGLQWWRLVTALTLHADLTHVLGNCFFGFVLIHFFFKMTGNGLGSFALLTSAVGGNLINTIAKGVGYSFIGFSTATFSVVGMLAMLSYHERKQLRHVHFLMPLMAGLAFLAMLGSSGERTDLGGHFFGLVCGLAAGRLLATQYVQKLRHSLVFQCTLFVLFISVISISWYLALTVTH